MIARQDQASVGGGAKLLHRLRKLNDRIRTAVWSRWLRMDPGVRIGELAFVGRNVRIRADTDGYSLGGTLEIGRNARIADGAVIDPYGGRIVIGDNLYLGYGSMLFGYGGIVIGNDALIGPQVTVIASSHGYASVDMPMNSQPITSQGITIGDDVWIGAGARILDGVSIGRGAIVAAGAVVTGDVGDHDIFAGVPARRVRNRTAA